MQVLFVGHYTPLAKAVKRGLEDEGIPVNLAISDHEAESLILQREYSIVVFDLRRSTKDIHLVKPWRSDHIKTPVLFLTDPSLDELPTNRSQGDGIGWIVKPFRFQQLLDRIYSLTSRQRLASGN